MTGPTAHGRLLTRRRPAGRPARGNVLLAALLLAVLVPGSAQAVPPTRVVAAAPTGVLAAGPVLPCGQSPVPPDATYTMRPVVLVHGWNSNPTVWNSTIALLQQMPSVGTRRFTFLAFDYSALSAHWPNDPDIHQCLAQVLVAASQAYRRGGGDGRVLAMGHSMGGVAIRYASQDTVNGTPVASVLAGVVTLGTPHLGSPWGGTTLARAVQTASQSWASGFTGTFPPADSDAQACLAPLARRPATCGTTPYLPQGVPLAEIGAQIYIQRTLFDIGLFHGPTASLPLFGDGIVPADSATGYIGSGPTVKRERRVRGVAEGHLDGPRGGRLVDGPPSDRPVRLLPSGTAGVIYLCRPYPLYEGDYIDLADTPVAKSERIGFAEPGEKLRYSTPAAAEPVPGLGLARWYVETNRFGRYLVFDATQQPGGGAQLAAGPSRSVGVSLATPKGMCTLGANREAPSRCRCWSSKKMCGCRTSMMRALSMPPRKNASLTVTPQALRLAMARSWLGASRAVTMDTCTRIR